MIITAAEVKRLQVVALWLAFKNCIFDLIITTIVETISEKAEVFAAGMFADNEINKQALLDRMNTVVKKQYELMLAADREL